MYKRRAQVVKDHHGRNEHLIDHCSLLEFDCPHIFERMKTIDHENSACGKCRRNVKRVVSVPELRVEQSLGNCVSQFWFDEEEEDVGFGLFD